MPQAKQTDEQILKELQQSLDLIDESDLPAVSDRHSVVVEDLSEDDESEMEAFWRERAEKAEREWTRANKGAAPPQVSGSDQWDDDGGL